LGRASDVEESIGTSKVPRKSIQRKATSMG
jgi:hypothetical protein